MPKLTAHNPTQLQVHPAPIKLLTAITHRQATMLDIGA